MNKLWCGVMVALLASGASAVPNDPAAPSALAEPAALPAVASRNDRKADKKAMPKATKRARKASRAEPPASSSK